MEAQASGLAVIASRVGGIPSLIEDRKTGILVEPENVNELAKEIIGLLTYSEKIKELGLNAREFALKNYSSEQMVEKTVTVYKSLVSA
ncbi:MAG: glycosyltransferase family 4 protein [Candidatus Omnitrophica bacterium]|nr:glycosyltransferase family 4 protein [Candidatus Omnitrophota bacterium]